MIISRTPLRISFFGGGTDYPAWFKEHGGAVLSTTIDKYIYLSSRHLPPFFEHKSRIVWSLIELVKGVEEIKHPSVRECLKFMEIEEGIEIHYNADLPAKTGLGSSSSFTVGLLNSLNAYKGRMIAKEQLAHDAIHVEQNCIKENVGCQDQIAAAFGGFNLIEFVKGDSFKLSPLTISPQRIDEFQRHLMLVFTGFSRIASEVAGEIIKKAPQKKQELSTMHQMVYEGIQILNSAADIKDFGKLMHESWQLKRSLADNVSNPDIDRIYETARRAGAVGGKILGAGNGGFMLLFAEPSVQEHIRQELPHLLHVPFAFENLGSQIIYYANN